MRTLDYLILVEHISRELDVATCLAHLLREQTGASVEVKSYFLDFDANVARYEPATLVFPFYYGADSFNTKYLTRWPNTRVVNMCWEQMLSKIDVSMKVPRDDTARTNVHHLCWSERHRDFLLGHGVRADRLLLTGNPAMKLYDRPYRGYFENRESLAGRHGIDPARKWVLFPEAYQYNFMSDDWMQWQVDNQNAELGLMREAREYSRASLQALLSWANELQRTDDPVFILRPRPSTPREEANAYVQRVLGTPSPNFKVVKRESSREWILAADHVISSHSTTLIEAAIAGKPVHIFAPEPLPEAIGAEWHAMVPHLRDRESFLSAVRQVDQSPPSVELANWARGFMRIDRDPLQEMTNALVQLHPSPGQRTHRPDHRRLWNFGVLAEIARVRDRQQVRETDHALEDFHALDVARRVARWRRALK